MYASRLQSPRLGPRFSSYASFRLLLVALALLIAVLAAPDGQAAGQVPSALLSDKEFHIDDLSHRKLVAAGDSTDNEQRSSSTFTAQSTTRKVAVILANFSADPQQPWTTQQVRDLVFTGDYSVNSYFREESSDQLSLAGKLSQNGDIFGWYTLSSGISSCNYDDWGAQALQAAAADGVDLSGYQHYIIMWPRVQACWWSGLAEVDGSLSMINGSLTVRVIAHELGHNLDLLHANTYTCTDRNGQRVAISDNCSETEYGDPFDVMGSASSRHQNNWNKMHLGFLPAQNMRTVTESGTYNLAPSERSLVGEIQTIRVPITADFGSTRYYYLEFRRPYGIYYDNFSNSDFAVTGVSIRIGANIDSTAPTDLLDANPSSSTVLDAPLQTGQTFSDVNSGVTVKTVTVSSLAATIQVDVDPPGNSNGGSSDTAPPNDRADSKDRERPRFTRFVMRAKARLTRNGTAIPISFALSEDAHVTVKLRDRRKRVVARLTKRARADSNSLRLRVPNGVRAGNYTLTLSAKDGSGNRSKVTKRRLKLTRRSR